MSASARIDKDDVVVQDDGSNVVIINGGHHFGLCNGSKLLMQQFEAARAKKTGLIYYHNPSDETIRQYQRLTT